MTRKHHILDRVSYHAVYDDSFLSAMQYAHENGFHGVEIAVETPHLSFESLTARDMDDIRDFSAQNGILISLHAPDDVTSLFVHNESLRKGVLAYYDQLFDFAKAVMARLVTIHMGFMTTFPTDTIPEKKVPEIDLPIYEALIRQNLDHLVKGTEERFLLCVENYRLDRTILPLLQKYLDDGKIFLCWDIAKSYGNRELEQYFWSNLKAIKQVHLHDLSPVGERMRSHRVIGNGEIDFISYLTRMVDEDILDYCIEVRPREKALESLENLIRILTELEANSQKLS